MWWEKNILCHIVDMCPPPLPIPKVCNGVPMRWSFRQTSSTLRPEQGSCVAADSLARGDGGLRWTTWALVPLFGVLLTVHHVSNPKVTSHSEVEATICASVALWVAETVVCDAHDLCSVERWAQSDKTQTHTVASDNSVEWLPSFPMQMKVSPSEHQHLYFFTNYPQKLATKSTIIFNVFAFLRKTKNAIYVEHLLLYYSHTYTCM